MAKRLLLLMLITLCCVSAAYALYRQAAAPVSPSDADQLVIVRVTAALNDAYARRDKAQLEYDKAVRDIQDLQPELQKAVASARSKLPAPAAGMQWAPEPDGRLGVRFVQTPVPGSAQKEQPR